MKPDGMKGCSRKGQLPHITGNQQRKSGTTRLGGVLQRIFYMPICQDGEMPSAWTIGIWHGLVPQKTPITSYHNNEKVMKPQTNLACPL